MELRRTPITTVINWHRTGVANAEAIGRDRLHPPYEAVHDGLYLRAVRIDGLVVAQSAASASVRWLAPFGPFSFSFQAYRFDW